MIVRSKGNTNIKSGWVCTPLFVILTFFSFAANTGISFHRSLTPAYIDSPPPKKTPVILADKRIIVNDSPPVKPVIAADTNRIITVKDSTVFTKDSFDFRVSKDSLDGPVVYHADDSMVLDVPGKKMTLYGKVSTIKYAENDLSAPEIQYDQKTNLVKAYLKKDSTGKVISYVSFQQGDFKSVMDSITFDMKTQRGITKGTYTQQGEMYVYGEKIKRVNPEVFYALNSRFTTCNLDTPHFAFVSRRIKFINKKMAFSGPVHPEFEGVPIPIVLPFGIFPLQQGRHSGILSPNFTTNSSYGIGIENFGYYKVVSQNWDVITRGSVFSYGGWAAAVNPRYYKRYHYQGNFDIRLLKAKILDEPASQQFNLTWSHNMDNKARPGVTFSANVNAGSTKYNSLVPNSPITNFNNQLSSSINYAKVWKDRPYNIAVSANHNQNSVTRLINVDLPNLLFNLNTQYPFRRSEKERVGELKWYENIGIGLNTNAKSVTSFFDTANIIVQAKKNFEYGVSHSVPITLSLPPLGVVQVAPSISYRETWFQKKSIQSWNTTTKKIDTSITNGFYTARDMSFGLSLGTRIFGLFAFGPKSKVSAIRHELRPSVGISYKPDFTKGSTRYVQIDSAGTVLPYSIYNANRIYGPFSSGQFGGLTFSLDNNLTMKLRNRKDTSAAGLKKVSLLDGLQLNGSYNFLEDSFRLSPLSLSAFTNLFNKFNLTASATFDPYQVNDFGRRIDKLVLAKHPYSLGTLNNASISLQSSFRGGDKKGAVAKQSYQENSQISGVALDEYQQEAAYIQQNPGQFADFSIPWSIDFAYSFSINQARIIGTRKLMKTTAQSVNTNASVNLTPKWKIGANGSFNITNGELGVLSMYLSRDLHCWQMSINVAPAGRYRFFSINISPKSPILRDLKVNRTRSFNNF